MHFQTKNNPFSLHTLACVLSIEIILNPVLLSSYKNETDSLDRERISRAPVIITFFIEINTLLGLIVMVHFNIAIQQNVKITNESKNYNQINLTGKGYFACNNEHYDPKGNY